MIARLQGRVLEKQPTRLVVDVQGVGYEVHVPLSTFYDVGDPGSDVALHVHTHVREDALLLFGFLTALEQEIFERLIGISGIGPKLALAVLSGIEPLELVRAIRHGDVARLTAIPGIGKRSAERIGLELKDRLPAVLAEEVEAPDAVAGADDLRGDVLSALVNLGYHRQFAERAVERALGTADDETGDRFELTLRFALRELSK